MSPQLKVANKIMTPEEHEQLQRQLYAEPSLYLPNAPSISDGLKTVFDALSVFDPVIQKRILIAAQALLGLK